jgi:Skp family chaperone for outer membrane proteins
MSDKHVVRWLVTGALLMMAGTGLAAEKIAVVDMNDVIAAHPDTDANRAVLEEQAAEFEAEHEKMLAELKDMQTRFEALRRDALNKALNEAARDEKRSEAEQSLMEMRDFEQQIRENLNLRQKQISSQKLRMHRRVLEDITNLVRAYAQQQNIALVLDKSGAGLNGTETVVYSADALNITADIVRRIKETTKPTKE